MKIAAFTKTLTTILAFSTLSFASLAGAAYSDAGQKRDLSWDEVLELRYEYEERVKALRNEIPVLKRQHFSEEQIAKLLHAKRRELGLKFKMDTPEYLQGSIYKRNQEKYGDPLGPSIEYLRAQGKGWAEIIDSATKPGGGDLGSGVFYNVGSFVHWIKGLWQGNKSSEKVGENWP